MVNSEKDTTMKKLILYPLLCLGFSFMLSQCKTQERNRGGLAGSGNESGQGGSGPLSYSNNPHIDKFLALVKSISLRAEELNREKDRRGKLRLALTNGATGCMQDVPIRSVKVVIKGSKYGDLDVSSHFKDKNAPPEGTGKAMFHISFGDSEWTDSLVFQNDEYSHSLFSGGSGKTFTTNRTNFTLGSFQTLKIEKSDSSYFVNNRCEGGNFISACRNNRVVKEQDRFFLKGFEVWVNGLLVYERGAIDHVFANFKSPQDPGKTVGLSWQDSHVNINDSFVKVMQLEDCSQYQ